jgi:putative exporter of polyketide antibiotics
MVKLLLHEIRMRRGAIIGWTIGLAAFILMYVTVYPTLPPEYFDVSLEDIEFYKVLGVMNMATFEGYLFSVVYNLLPLLAGIFGITLGVGVLARGRGQRHVGVTGSSAFVACPACIDKSCGVSNRGFPGYADCGIDRNGCFHRYPGSN